MHCWNYRNVRKSIQDSKFATFKLFNIIIIFIMCIYYFWELKCHGISILRFSFNRFLLTGFSWQLHAPWSICPRSFLYIHGGRVQMERRGQALRGMRRRCRKKTENKTEQKQNKQTNNRCRGFKRATLLIRFTLSSTFPKPNRLSDHGPSDYVKGVVVSL